MLLMPSPCFEDGVTLGQSQDPLIFCSPSLCSKEFTELQQMDKVFDTTLVNIIQRNSLCLPKLTYSPQLGPQVS